MSIYKFPDGFKWGSATSAHQVEGNNHNDWSEWEQSPERIAQLKKEGKNPSDFISGKTCDSYNRYEEDFDIAKKLNQNIHRFSIEWSRIEPEEGKLDFEAMKHYQRLVKALRDRGMEPMVTLWHFTNPIWFTDKGGWLNRQSPKYFTRYVKYVVDNLKDRVGLWITFNEANIYAGAAYIQGQWPPQSHNIFKAFKIRNNIIKSHILAYQEVKRIYSVPSSQGHNSPISHNSDFSTSLEVAKSHNIMQHTDMSHNIVPLIGGVENNIHIIGHPILKRVSKFIDNFLNLYFWNKTLPYQDFIGLNYYTTLRLSGTREPRQGFAEEMGWEIYPKGIYYRLIELKKFKKPIYITENGIADRTDKLREKFIKDHLYWVWRAIRDGADARGYLYWSLLDNFEWARGFTPRFGLVEIDYATLERKIRPSAYTYAKICASNTLLLND